MINVRMKLKPPIIRRVLPPIEQNQLLRIPVAPPFTEISHVSVEFEKCFTKQHTFRRYLKPTTRKHVFQHISEGYLQASVLHFLHAIVILLWYNGYNMLASAAARCRVRYPIQIEILKIVEHTGRFIFKNDVISPVYGRNHWKWLVIYILYTLFQLR